MEKKVIFRAAHHALLIVATTLLLFFAVTSHASADPWQEPMEFRVMTTSGNCPSCTWIRAYGRIDNGTPETFRRFIRAQNLLQTGGIQVHLSSPGGSLFAGMELGRLIRNYGMSTVVSTSLIRRELPGGHHEAIAVEHMTTCASACNFAFLGGVVRYASESTPPHEIGYQKVGRLGAHQFYNADALTDPDALTRTANDAISDQLAVAHLLAFLDEMDVSAEFLQLASKTPPTDLHYFTEEELIRTEADNFATRDVFIVGYRNGVAITELRFARPDADYRIELYCAAGVMRMLTNVSWRAEYDVEAHRSWDILNGLELLTADGASVAARKIDEEFDGAPRALRGKFRFSFQDDSLERFVGLKRFTFRDNSSRYASQAADSLSFELPPDFDGLFLMPRTCLK